MKQILSYTLVGVVSAITTVGVYNYVIKNPSNDCVNSEKNITHFASTTDRPMGNLPNPDFTFAAEKSLNAVVNVKNFSKNTSSGTGNMDDPFEYFFGRKRKQSSPKQNEEPEESGHGSGVIISTDGYIVTNNHVIKGAEKIEITLNNKKSYAAEIIGTDPSTDIALLKINPKEELTSLNFYDSDNVKVGEWVLAVGNPFSLTSTVTAGIISAKGRSLDILRRNSDSPIESFLQTDAAINPGNSGGALVNTNGDLVGINSAISSQTGTYEGYGFAVPSNLVKKIIDDIKKYGLVQRGYIGINGLDLGNESAVKKYNEDKGKRIKTQEGVLITALSPDGAAISAGLEEGDIIKDIDGKRIKTFSELSFIIGSKRPGDNVAVTVLRGSAEKSYTITLRDSKGKTGVRTKSDLTIGEKIGAEFEPLTANQKLRLGIEYGLLVSKITEGGKLASLGIDEGFVILKINNKELRDPKDVDRLLNGNKGDVSVSYVDPYGRIMTGGFRMD